MHGFRDVLPMSRSPRYKYETVRSKGEAKNRNKECVHPKPQFSAFQFP